MELLKNVRVVASVLYFRIRHGSPRAVERHWENFWRTVEKTGREGEVLWDNEPHRASAEDLERFKSFVDPSLPILDLGCGNGRQSRYLARHFDRVVGADVSPSAVARARAEAAEAGVTNVEFRVLNALKPEEARAFHDEFGDVNVYMRLLLHTLQKVDRPRFAESLAVLLGEKGTLYQIELSLRAIDYFRTLPGDSPSGLPRLVHKVVRSGAAAPKGFDPRERPLVYPDDRWQVLAEGQDVEINTVPLSHGREGNIPASYLILRQRAERAA